MSIIILICQACYFGAGLVEADLTDDFFLFANNSIDELSIWYFPGDNGSNLIVKETVFAVGNNDKFIIAKSHPKNSGNKIDKNVTLYHIIEVEKFKINPKESHVMTLEKFESTRRKLNIPATLDFTKFYKELE